MVQQLWAPWRLEYVRGETRDTGCPFCEKPQMADEDSLVIHRSQHGFVVLNLYPYNPYHVLIVPFRHVADLTELSHDESADLQRLLEQSLLALRSTVNCDGANVGLNLGSAAGAGIAAHLHWHIVPRWQGDTNFMPILAETKVMPQHMSTIYEALRDGFDALTEE